MVYVKIVNSNEWSFLKLVIFSYIKHCKQNPKCNLIRAKKLKGLNENGKHLTQSMNIIAI